MAQDPQVAWLGLGNMGRGMCRNLATKGNLQRPLIIYNRTQKRSDDLASSLSGVVKVAYAVSEAVAPSDIVFTCLSDDTSVQETINAALQSGDIKDKLFVDCSTLHPDTTNALSKQITEAGAHFVAMPVFGPPVAAAAGKLFCVLAGPAPLVERVKLFTIGVLGNALIDMSDQQPGNASLLKLVGNTFIFNMVEAISQALVLSEKTGLGVGNLHNFIEAMFPGPYTSMSTRMHTGAYYKTDPLFAVDLARKDAGHAMKLAEDAGCRLKNIEVADQHLEAVMAHQGSKGDITSIYGAVRQEGGLKFEID